MIYVLQTCPECGGKGVRVYESDEASILQCHLCLSCGGSGRTEVAAVGNEEFEEFIMQIVKRKGEQP